MTKFVQYAEMENNTYIGGCNLSTAEEGMVQNAVVAVKDSSPRL